MRRLTTYLLVLLTALSALLAVLLPPWISAWGDQALLEQTYTEDVDAVGAAFIYQFSLADKLRLLSEGMGDQNSRYLYVATAQPTEDLLTQEQMTELLPGELARLAELGVLPALPTGELFFSSCYTIIDRELPQRNLSYWSLFLVAGSTTLSLSMDAETGLLYQVDLMGGTISGLSPQQVARGWGDYLDLTPPPSAAATTEQSVVYYESDGEPVPYQLILRQDAGDESTLTLLPGDGTGASALLDITEENLLPAD